MDNSTVGTLKYDLTVDNSQLQKGLADSSKSVKNFGDQAKDTGSNIQEHMKAASVALAGIAVGLTLYAKNATDYTVQAVKDAKSLGTQLGISTTEASRLTAAVERMGISADATKQMFGIFEKQIQNATDSMTTNSIANQKLELQMEQTKNEIAKTTKEIQTHGDKTGELALKVKQLQLNLKDEENQLSTSQSAFDKLGISVVDNTGKQKDFETILFEVADKFKDMPNGIEKTDLALQLFGRSGKDMVKVLNLGSQGIQDLEKNADKLGLTLNQNNIVAVNNLVQSQKDLKEQQDALKIAVGTTTAPVMTKYNEMINHVTQSLINTKGPVHDATVGILAFGGPVAGAASGLTGFLANLDQAGPALAKVGSSLGSVFTNPYVIAIVAIAAAVFLLVQHFGGLNQVLKDLQPVIQYFQMLWQMMYQMWLQIQPAVMTMIGLIGDALKSAFDRIISSVISLWNALNPALLDALKVLGVLIGGTLVVAIGVIVGGLLILAEVIRIVVAVVTDLIHWIGNLIGWVGNAYAAVANAAVGIIVWFSNIRDHVASVINTIKGLWGSAGSWLYNAGRDMIQGLINGIENMAQSVFNKVASIGSEAVKKLKGVLKIFSPSQVFHEIGTFVGQGLVNGIESMTGAVQDASGNLASAVVTPNMDLMSGGGAAAMNPGIVNNQQSSQVTYRIGQVQLTTPAAVDEFFSIGNRNVQLESQGGSPLAGTTRV